VKWRLLDANDREIRDLASFLRLISYTVLAVTCPAALSRRSRSRRWKLAPTVSGRRQLAVQLKTPKGYANQCRVTRPERKDGTHEDAQFMFKK
jgi:hypothetical protein